MRPAGALLAALALLALPGAAAPDTLDAIARDYVRLALEAGERDPGFVDAYYGPPAWAAAAKARPRTVAALEADARTLLARVEAIAPPAPQRARRASLIGQLRAAATRMAMVGGRRFAFDDEAEGLFGVRPVVAPLASFDPLLARMDALLPGAGPLAERYAAWRRTVIVPRDRIERVTALAIAECRRRTVPHVPLPRGERFTLGLASDKAWSAYNYYLGGYASRIDVNTDRPVTVANTVDYGCHEGYPGHHVYNALIERDLMRGRGWIEYAVYPLYSPQSLIAEGSANHGIDLAFPEGSAAFERERLYPAAGLPPPAARDAEIASLDRRLNPARFAIARDYLDGRIDRARAVALFARYRLVPPAEADGGVRFFDQYRSYVINYGYGRVLVAAAVAPGRTAAARWARFRRILSNPTTPADLVAMAKDRGEGPGRTASPADEPMTGYRPLGRDTARSGR